jgi:hypothetical protein
LPLHADIITHSTYRSGTIYHDKNRGPIANFLTLLENTTSKYFVVLGAHDIFLSNYITNAISFLESNPDYVMVYPQSKLVDGNDSSLGYVDSDIDSHGLNVQQRMKKTAANLSWCTCFHGVFKTDIMKKLPVLQIRGNDHLILFAAAYYGRIHFMHTLGILRRESRQETTLMTENRRIKSGIYLEPTNKMFDSWSVMAVEHILFVIKRTSLTVVQKINLSFSIASIFKRRFNCSFISMAFAYAHKK